MDKNFMGQRLKIARKNKYLSGERLAELCNINATYLRQIEAGKKIPSLPVFISLCNILEVSPTYLLEDMLTKNELTDFETLSNLWSSATPGQIELVTTMIRSALEYMN